MRMIDDIYTLTQHDCNTEGKWSSRGIQVRLLSDELMGAYTIMA